VTPAGLIPRTKRFTVVGLFSIDMYEYDSTLALVHIDDAAKLFKLKGNVSGVRIKLNDVFKSQLVRHELIAELGPGYGVSDWTREHRNFFRALKIEKRVMFIILTLIVSVAAFNIVSTLVMMVTDKQSDIAILRTLGMSPSSVMTVFITQGTLIGVIGTAIGAVLGVITAINIEQLVPFVERLLGIEFFPGDIYVISDFPAELHTDDVIKIVIMALILSLVATIYPAWRAARTQPAQALRYD
jgi:lipoprotein-releasing system permease protein